MTKLTVFAAILCATQLTGCFQTMCSPGQVGVYNGSGNLVGATVGAGSVLICGADRLVSGASAPETPAQTPEEIEEAARTERLSKMFRPWPFNKL